MSLGSAMCGGLRCVACPVFGGLCSALVGCVFQWGMLAFVSRSFRMRVGVGRWSNFSCVSVLCVMLLHIRVSFCVPEPNEGGAYKDMTGVNHSCVWGCSLVLGVLTSM